MRRSIVIRSFLLLALASPAAAQGFDPSISSIPPRPAFAPDQVTIRGSFLGLVLDVRIDGVAYPILRSSDNRLVVGPVPPLAPGFARVVLSNGGGSTAGTLELTPTLAATRRGQKFTATLRNGGAGTYLLAGSFRRLPVLVPDAGVYYGRWISVNSPVLAAGVFAGEDPVAVTAKVPIHIGLIGVPLNLQARCTLTGSDVVSYTNVTSVPGIGSH